MTIIHNTRFEELAETVSKRVSVPLEDDSPKYDYFYVQSKHCFLRVAHERGNFEPYTCADDPVVFYNYNKGPDLRIDRVGLDGTVTELVKFRSSNLYDYHRIYIDMDSNELGIQNSRQQITGDTVDWVSVVDVHNFQGQELRTEPLVGRWYRSAPRQWLLGDIRPDQRQIAHDVVMDITSEIDGKRNFLLEQQRFLIFRHNVYRELVYKLVKFRCNYVHSSGAKRPLGIELVEACYDFGTGAGSCSEPYCYFVSDGQISLYDATL